MKPFPAGVALCLAAGCALHQGGPDRALASGCRPAQVDGHLLAWSTPASVATRRRLDAWCAGVGPPLFHSVPTTESEPPRLEDIAFVSWNVHVGLGDIARFMTDLRAGRYSAGHPVRDFVLLLQETVRRADVPTSLAPGARAASRIGGDDLHLNFVDELADAPGVSLLYVPSMRNGPEADDEMPGSDRGNAILSTLPLIEARAIELPGARQRRVAIEAAISVAATRVPLRLNVASAHLNVLGPARSLWVFGATVSRAHQADRLVKALADGPTVVGADLNTWQGSDEPALRLLRAAFPDTPPFRATTFRGGLMLDRLLLRLPGGWQGRVIRGDERYGADHYPLILWVTPTATSSRGEPASG